MRARARQRLYTRQPMEDVEEQLREQRDYTRAVIDTASSMIVVTEADGTVIAANQATADLTGFTEAELVGHRFWDVLVPRSHRREIAAAFGSTDPIPTRGETLLVTRALDQRLVEYSTASHRASPGAPLYYVLSATDVTAARETAGMVSHLLRSASATAFVATDLDGWVTLFNTGAESLLGIPAEEATGRRFVDFISTSLAGDTDVSDQRGGGATVPSFADLVAGTDRAEPQPRHLTWLPTDQTPIHVVMTTNPVRNTFGQLVGYLFVATDDTDARRSQEILVRALSRERSVVARLRDLDRAKDDFVSTVSHELRTPMSSILGSAEMLSDGLLGDLGPEQASVVGVISRNGDRLLALADDLLLLVAFDQSAWEDHRVEIDLRDVVAESLDSVAAALASRDLHLDVRLPEEPVHVLGDAGHLERAVTNLLGNAVKFTEDGGTIEVDLTSRSRRLGAVLTVRDTGLGIPSEELESVFGRFFRSAQVQERAIQGTGLGLAIVKTIVEAHEGRIDVRSQEGVGTTFTVRLPLA